MDSQSHREKLRIVSLNVRGVSNLKKRRSMFNFCRKLSADLILLQETHSTQRTETHWQHEWGGKIIFSHGSSNEVLLLIFLKMMMEEF